MTEDQKNQAISNMANTIGELQAKFSTVESLVKSKEAGIQSIANDLAAANVQIQNLQSNSNALGSGLKEIKKLVETDGTKLAELKTALNAILANFNFPEEEDEQQG